MIKIAVDFCNEAKARGYKLSGSVFKVDYNGRVFTVGFWIRPTDYDYDKQKYNLPGLVGKAKHEAFETAVKMAIEKAKEGELE